jgi:four helix bundle protein
MNRFSFQKLRVYNDLTHFIAFSEGHVSMWDKAHAIVDHFYRASEGSVVCLAEACRNHKLGAKQQAVDYSAGSILECAACVDIAQAKNLCQSSVGNAMKQRLDIIFRQLIALRHSWERSEIREDSPEYGASPVFNHEHLDVYQLAINVHEKLTAMRIFEGLSRSDFRRLDEPATSLTLNIAEGNGRFAHLDHRRFLEIANLSTTKLAARLEVCALRGTVDKKDTDEIVETLVSIDRMTAKLATVWRETGLGFGRDPDKA